MNRGLAIYQKLPYPMRVIAASARGAQLSHGRYGSDTDGMVTSALRREYWGLDEWDGWITPRLERILATAATSAPFYRDIWDSRGGFAAVGDLQAWPVLTKEQLRSQSERFLSQHTGKRVADHTSGTSGTPLTLQFTRESVRSWYSLFEARVRVWNKTDRRARWALLGGQLVVPPSARRPPYWVWSVTTRQLYLSAFHISDDTAADYTAAIRRSRARYLLAYPSAAAALAASIQRTGISPPALDFVATNAEPLLSEQRQLIESVFGCPVRETYGMAEAVVGASECAEGRLHLWPEAGILEILQDDCDQPVHPGETGRVVCTGLLNTAMPLIRYEVGDRAALWPGVCRCGRTLPVLASVEGRLDDVVVTRDGRRIGRLDGMFKSELPVKEAQIVQRDYDRFQILVVAAEGYDDAVATQLASALCERVGPVSVETVAVPYIPRTANGKFRSVVSHVGRGDEGRHAGPEGPTTASLNGEVELDWLQNGGS